MTIETKATTDDGSVLTFYGDGTILIERPGIDPINISQEERELMAELTPIRAERDVSGAQG